MISNPKWHLPEDRYFDPEPAQRRIAIELYKSVSNLPLICPHGHVDPKLFSDENASLGTPADLLIIPDHYVFRMLYSHGFPLEALGIPRKDGGPVEKDHRKIWQIFAEHFYLFRGTPTGVWLADELHSVFGIEEKLTGQTAQPIYDQIEAKLKLPEFQPRSLFKRFNIEVMTTTDAATDPLVYHQAIRRSRWDGNVRPTFRPDAVINLLTPDWRNNIEALSRVSGITVASYKSFIQALEERRTFFKSMGAVATDHAAETAYTAGLSSSEAETIFQRALQGKANNEEAKRFNAHLLMEFARMSIEDGLVMQLHVGAIRDHNNLIYNRFGANMGADIPGQSEFTKNLRPLLNKYGNDARLTLILFTLDESTYSRELAPLAGHYPAIKLGPPWWFHDSVNGMRRYLDRVMETAGIHNTAGFNDDTRAFPSIPARHDLWRRVCANWIAGLMVKGIVDAEDAQEMMLDMAYRLAKKAYKL
ncbi:MAG TPA: glucuronate isomerase [Thermodesulfobacteriota bacterium]|nr:glucuronate isomerase [Thermodesulfobacteriota bacterium]